MASTSGRADPDKLSLYDLPPEIRLEICGASCIADARSIFFNLGSANLFIPFSDAILDLSNVPSTYGYTGPFNLHRKPELQKHGMILVSKTISAEYRQAFYERTNFFLRIDNRQAYKAIPILHRMSVTAADRFQLQDERITAKDATLPNFWDAPDAMLRNLRHCTLFVELGEIVQHRKNAYLQSVARNSTTTKNLHEGAKSMRSFLQSRKFKGHINENIRENVKEDNKALVSKIASTIHRLLDGMQQLRSIHLVWETTMGTDRDQSCAELFKWEDFGYPFVYRLQKIWNLKEFRIKIGNRLNDRGCEGVKTEGGKWHIEDM